MNAEIDKIINDVVGDYLANKESQNFRTTQNITLEFARKLIYKVEDKAKEMGVKAVVAVSDAAGIIIAV